MALTPQLLTLAGKAKLQEELAELKGPRREEIARRLKHAIEMGDLSENADYHMAKEDQGFLEGRIQQIEAVLSSATLIEDTDINTSTVQIGNTVTLQEDNEPEETFIIVGANEASPRERKISYESPMGAALMGHKKGETVEVILPNKSVLKIKILKIE
ncbi:MAG TPA: transcription elongation factor GreA [Anaerolineaceae bacterium]|nr:transcription elongation factor GreA [Anaerolineaceae bacterium]HPR34104.1 transcription elongation factor GreA [Anaerolineaceae bacterium]